MEEEFIDYTHEGYVKNYFPTAYVKDAHFLSRVYVDVNGLSFWQEISCNLTDDQAWEDAAEWVYNISYHIEQKKKNTLRSLDNNSQLDLFMKY